MADDIPRECPATGTSTHAPGCYKVVLSCPKVEHTHSDKACFTKDGNRKCPYPNEHTHDRVDCYGAAGPFCGGT